MTPPMNKWECSMKSIEERIKELKERVNKIEGDYDNLIEKLEIFRQRLKNLKKRNLKSFIFFLSTSLQK